MVTQTPDGAVEFQFYRPGARQVLIAGDFNGWQKSFHMTASADGQWCARIQLAPGVYQFRYWADGHWFPDYAAFGLEPGPFGWNSVVMVDGEAPAAVAAPPLPVSATMSEAEPKLTVGRPLRTASPTRRPPNNISRPGSRPAEHSGLRIAPVSQRGVALAG